LIYFDNSATTALYDDVFELVAKLLKEQFGNASSLHRLGFNAEKYVTEARIQVAQLLQCREDEIYFTSGGTESDNIAVFGTALTKKNVGKRIVTTEIEHPAVKNCCLALEKQGFEIVFIKPENNKINNQDILDAITKETILVSCMSVNNETGEILDLSGIKEKMKQVGSRGLFHIDNIQGFGKIKNILNYSPDLVSISSHKLHGPKGVGALYIKKGTNFVSHICGGGQEKNIRSGTYNMPSIAGFGLACKIKTQKINEDKKKVNELSAYLIEKLKALPFEVILNIPSNHLGYIVNFSVTGIKSEVLLHFLESKDIYVSSGSACSSKSKKGSPVLNAMGLESKVIDSSIRVSFCASNTKEEIDALTQALIEADKSLAKVNPKG